MLAHGLDEPVEGLLRRGGSDQERDRTEALPRVDLLARGVEGDHAGSADDRVGVCGMRHLAGCEHDGSATALGQLLDAGGVVAYLVVDGRAEDLDGAGVVTGEL